MSKTRMAWLLSAATAMALVTAPAVLTNVSASAVTPTAAAPLGCDAGIWGGIYGWGECYPGHTGKWQLKVSCTWAGQGLSGVMTGAGHVDVQCNRGSARNASIIHLG